MSSVVLFVLGPLAVAVLAAVLVVRRGLQLKQLLADGVQATATVVRKIRFGAGKYPYIRYSYRDARGAVYTHKSMVTRRGWDALDVGSAIAIVYSASRPAVSAPLDLVEQARSGYRR